MSWLAVRTSWLRLVSRQDPSPDQRTDQAVLVGLVGMAGFLALVAPTVRRRVVRVLPAPVAEVVVPAGLAALGWAGVAVTERLHPYRPEWNESQDDVATDLGFFLVSSPIAGVIATLTAEGLARTATGGRSQGPAQGGLARFPWPVQAAAALAVTELIHYWHHRLSHRSRLLWRLHQVHHSPSRLYWLNAVRFHPIDVVVLVTLQLLGLRLLRIDADAMVAAQVFRGIHGQIQHSNVAIHSGSMGLVLSTPDQHRWHHASDRQLSDANYGAVLSIYDRMFGTSEGVDGRAFTGTVGLSAKG